MAPNRSSLGALRRQPTPKHLYTSPILIQTDDGRLFDSSIKFNHITGLQDNPFLVTKSRSKPYIIAALAFSAFAYMIFSESLGFKSLIMADQRPKFQIPNVVENNVTAASSEPSEVVLEEDSADDVLGPDDDAFVYSPDYDESSGDTAEPKRGDEPDSEDSVVRDDDDEENAEDAEIEETEIAETNRDIARNSSLADEEHHEMASERDDEGTDNGSNETELGTQQFEGDDALATDDESDDDAVASQRLSSPRHNATLDISGENAGDEDEVA